MKEIFQRPPLDRDLFFDNAGDIYQVITNVHPSDRIVALRKYQYFMNKPDGVFFWQSPKYPGFYVRAIDTYNVKKASSNIAKSNYARISNILGVPMIEVPLKEIQVYLYPEQGLRAYLRNGNENEWESALNDIVTQFEGILGIDEKSMGITGSLLWGAQHNASDIDVVIYGSDNARQFMTNMPELLKKSMSIHLPPPEFIERYAKTLAKKTGLELELTRQYISRKLYYLYYKKKFLSVSFVPHQGEISHQYENYSFHTLMPAIVKARIVDDRFGCFYPAEYKIQVEEVRIPSKNGYLLNETEVRKNLSTLVLMEREISGYYFTGNEIEIRGMLQAVHEGSEKYFQILIGTQELYGQEWVRVLN